MAFATRSLRVLCKIYNGTTGITYSTFRQPIHRVSLVQAAHRYCTVNNRPPEKPQITLGLTNIRATDGPGRDLMKETIEVKKKKEEEKQEAEQDRKKIIAKNNRMVIFIKVAGIAMCIVVTFIGYVLLRPEYDENGVPIQDEFSDSPIHEQLIGRFKREINYYTKYVQEPSRDKLLPDPLKYPYIQPPYTLILEMTDLLVHPDWTYQTGWRWKKRPGVDKFLETVAPPQFEIVVYTAEQGMTAFPILDILDPNGYIMYRLVRDSTHFVDGHHVKDLQYLNRDLRKVIVVDWSAENAKYNPENTLKIPRWNGNDDDTTLFDLAVFLKTIAASSVDDVRDVLRYYNQFENPLEVFRENQRKLLAQIEEEEHMKVAQEGRESFAAKWKRSFLQHN